MDEITKRASEILSTLTVEGKDCWQIRAILEEAKLIQDLQIAEDMECARSVNDARLRKEIQDVRGSLPIDELLQTALEEEHEMKMDKLKNRAR